ncbi:hypothetical protein D3C80_2008070 [compost metagenome]
MTASGLSRLKSSTNCLFHSTHEGSESGRAPSGQELLVMLRIFSRPCLPMVSSAGSHCAACEPPTRATETWE